MQCFKVSHLLPFFPFKIINKLDNSHKDHFSWYYFYVFSPKIALFASFTLIFSDCKSLGDVTISNLTGFSGLCISVALCNFICPKGTWLFSYYISEWSQLQDNMYLPSLFLLFHCIADLNLVFFSKCFLLPTLAIRSSLN